MRRKISSIAVAGAVLLSLWGQCAAAVTPTVEYTYKNVEEDIAVVPNGDLVLTNSATVDGNSVIGMTETYVYDEAKGKNVRSIGFNKKAAGENAAGAPNVRASIDGFAKYMTDENVNTISFDYKLSGASAGAIGMFMGNGVDDYGEHQDTGIFIGNAKGININIRPNRNTEGSDWYALAQNIWVTEASPNNRVWNRITLEVNKTNGEVTGYINGEFFSLDKHTAANGNPPTDMNSFLFQTAAGIENDGDLSILFDNIKVYPGKMKYTNESSYEGKWSFANGLVMEGFGFTDSSGATLTNAQADVCVKTKLTNTSTEGLKTVVYICGYKDGVMESVDLKLCDISARGSITLSKDANTLALDPAKEYDSIQLRILDGEKYYPLIQARKLEKAK